MRVLAGSRMNLQQVRNVLAETQRILADGIRSLNTLSTQPAEETPSPAKGAT